MPTPQDKATKFSFASPYLVNVDGVVSVLSEPPDPHPMIELDLSVFIKGVRNFEMIESHMIIEGLSETSAKANVLWKAETDLEARTYILRLLQVPAYRLIFSRISFSTMTRIVSSKGNNKVSIMME